MKKIYTSFLVLLCFATVQAQTFEFSLSYIGINPSTNYHQLALIATPSSMVTNGNTADMGAGFYVPSGLTIGNFVQGNSGLPASEWSTVPMGSNSNGDAYFVARIEAGQFSVYLNGSDPFELVIFDIIADPNPTSGQVIFVENGDPIFDTIFIENYMNINLGSGTDNYYSQNNPLANSVNFATLNIPSQVLNDTSITVYPNPTSEYINIATNNKIQHVELFDILGKKVGQVASSNKINVSQFQSGIYIIKVFTDKGQITKKIVIE